MATWRKKITIMIFFSFMIFFSLMIGLPSPFISSAETGRSNQPSSNQVDLLIFTRWYSNTSHSLINTYAQLLADYKNSTGIRTEVIDVYDLQSRSSPYYYADAKDDAERVKYAIYLKAKNEGVKYVMLVGDIGIFPVRYHLLGYHSSGEGPRDLQGRRIKDKHGNPQKKFIFLPCDGYFANLWDDEDPNKAFDDWNRDGDDFVGEMYRDNFRGIDGITIYPDVAVGRIPCSTPEEFFNYVIKVITFENQIKNSKTSHSALLLVGTYPHSDRTKQAIRDDLHQMGYWNKNIDVVYQTMPLDPVDLITQHKSHFINHAGHGSPGSWEVGLRYSDVANIDNFPDLSIVFAASCSTAKFANSISYLDGPGHSEGPIAPPYENDTNYNMDSMAEAFINKGPGVIYIGGVAVVQDKIQDLDKFFFRKIGEGEEIVGDAWRNAIKEYISYYHLGTDDPDDYENLNQTSEIWSEVPDPDDPANSKTHASLWDWVGLDSTFYHIFKVQLFGDPSLRINGIPRTGVDQIPPQTNIRINGKNVNQSTWVNNSQLSIDLYARDEGPDSSGVLTTLSRFNCNITNNSQWTNWSASSPMSYMTYTACISNAQEKAKIEFFSIDHAGNIEGVKSIEIGFDFTPPESQIQINGQEYATIIQGIVGYSQPLEVKINGRDRNPGSGVKEISYKVGNGGWVVHSGDEVSIQFNCFFSQESITIAYYSTDHAGNMEVQKTLTITLAPPTVKACMNKPWQEWSTDVGIASPTVRSDVINFQFLESMAGVFPDSVRFDFRGPITSSNENPSWQTIGTSTTRVPVANGFAFELSWDTKLSNIINGWYEVRSFPLFGAMAKKLSLNEEGGGLIFINNIPPKKYKFSVKLSKNKLKPGEKLLINASFSQGITTLHNVRLGLFLDRNLFIEKQDGDYERTTDTLPSKKTWKCTFELTLSPERTQPEEVEIIAYLRSEEINYLKSNPVRFFILYPDINISGNIFDPLGNPLQANLILQSKGLQSKAWKKKMHTKSDGSFLFKDVPANTYLLTVTSSLKGYRQVFPSGNVTLSSQGKDIVQNFLFAPEDKTPPWITQEFSMEEILQYGYLFGLVADEPWVPALKRLNLPSRTKSKAIGGTRRKASG